MIKWRLVPDARNQGYATEAGMALLGAAASTFRGQLLAMIDPTNAPSRAVAIKLGFSFWKQAVVNDYLDDIFELTIDT